MYNQRRLNDKSYLPALFLIIIMILVIYIPVRIFRQVNRDLDNDFNYISELKGEWKTHYLLNGMYRPEDNNALSLRIRMILYNKTVSFLRQYQNILMVSGWTETDRKRMDSNLNLFIRMKQEINKSPEIWSIIQDINRVERIFETYRNKQQKTLAQFFNLLHFTIAILFFYVIMLIVRYRSEIKEKDDLRLLSSVMEKDRDDKREELATEIHDTVVQDLAVLKMTLRSGNINPKETDQQIQNIADTLRNICYQIYPAQLSSIPLKDSLEQLLSDSKKRSSFELDYTLLGLDSSQLSQDMEKTVYRSLKELIRNCEKHSRADNVTVKVLYNSPFIKIKVQDNGDGFHVKKDMKEAIRNGHFGLASLREQIETRGGTFTIQSSSGSGTTISLSFKNGDKHG